jgi:predicted AAA+ superfamily ATPase
LCNVSPANIRKIKALVGILAQTVPYEVDITKLASLIGVQRNTVIDYLRFLGDARVLNLLYADLVSVKKMQKPDKIYLENANLIYTLATEEIKIGTVREAFTVNQLGYGREIEYGKQSGDFRVNGKYLFEVGGKTKSFDQIADIPNSYVLADDIETPIGKKLPLWSVGFLY